MDTIVQALQNNMGALIIGLLAGMTILLFLRAGQAWTHRKAFGYSTYAASRTQGTLRRWAFVGAGALTFVVFTYFYMGLQAEFVNSRPEPPIPASATQESPRLVIPLLGIDTAIIEAPIVGQQWDISRLTVEVAHLEGTAYPGEAGNAVFVGHVTIPEIDSAGPFYELDKLSLDQKIFVFVGGRTLAYRVIDRRKVQPADVQVAFPTADTRLTLITCSDWVNELDRYTGRLVVIAQLIN